VTVYLISLPDGRREPYFEPADDQVIVTGDDTRGWMARMRARFLATLLDLERRAHDARTAVTPRRWTGRLERRMVAWLASRIVEQRLLWYLRGEVTVALHHADRDSADEALQSMRGELTRDRARHLRGALLHGTLLLLSAPVAVIPGPNLLGYVFTFTAVGHALACLGAHHGLRGVEWQPVADAALTALAEALRADAGTDARDEAVARLPLTRLSLYLDRVAPPTA
jgi:hypothetical protein